MFMISTECMKHVEYGANCRKRCTNRNCASQSAPCDVHTGQCGGGGCSPGWKGVDCTEGTSHTLLGKFHLGPTTYTSNVIHTF